MRQDRIELLLSCISSLRWQPRTGRQTLVAVDRLEPIGRVYIFSIGRGGRMQREQHRFERRIQRKRRLLWWPDAARRGGTLSVDKSGWPDSAWISRSNG
jgi:hypothetical protein